MKPQTIIRLQREAIFNDRIGLHMAQRLPDGHIAIAHPFTFTSYPPDEILPRSEPIFSIDPTEAQHLMDELWHLGIRPTEGHGSTGQLAAVEMHRDDLRQMLDKTLATCLNVVNADIAHRHQLPVTPKPTAP